MRLIDNSLYTKILVWAYKKSERGFTEQELFAEFDLNDSNSQRWYLRVFRESPDILITNFNSFSEPVARWSLSALGMSYAVNYCGLKEAEKSGRRAERIALASIWITATIGLVQIIIIIVQSFHK